LTVNVARKVWFLVLIVFVGLFASCEGDPQSGVPEGEVEVEKFFSAYSELMNLLDSEEGSDDIKFIWNEETEQLDKIEFNDVAVTLESETYTHNGSLNFSSDGSSFLTVSLSANSLEEEVTLALDSNKNGEITSFKIDDIDYTEVFLEYLDAIPLYTEIIYISCCDDGSGTTPQVQKKTNGEMILIAGNTGNLTRDGYTFSGWSTSMESSTGTRYSVGEEYTTDEDLVLYAYWTAIPTYQISYNANGADQEDAPGTQIKQEGESLAIANKPSSMTRPGYSFSGWVTGTGTFYAPGVIYSADNDLELYAQWSKIGFATEDDYPIITGFSVDQNSISTCDEDNYVHFYVQASAPVGTMWKASVLVGKPEGVMVGSQSYIIANYFIGAEFPYYPDEIDYIGSTSSGTFTLALPTKWFNYKGIWKVIGVEVGLIDDDDNQIKTYMGYDQLVEENYNFEILQTSSDAF
jgi:uncharacterized repeat protein (TIGR02543 family)